MNLSSSHLLKLASTFTPTTAAAQQSGRATFVLEFGTTWSAAVTSLSSDISLLVKSGES
jgi:hypothetical protein